MIPWAMGTLIFYGGAGPASSATNRLTLEECLCLARESSETAMRAALDVSIADERYRQARSEVFPHLSVSATYTRLDELQEVDLGDGPLELGTLDNYAVEGRIEQLLFSGGRVRAALGAAQSLRGYSDATRAETDLRLVRNVRFAFIDILLAKEVIDVRKASVAQLESAARQTEQRRSSGEASEFDVLTARVRLGNERPELLRSRNTCRLALEDFRRLVGLDDETPFLLDGVLACRPVRVDPAVLRDEAMSRRGAVRALSKLVDLRDRDARAARSGTLPDVRAIMTYNGGNSYGFVSFDDEWEWHWTGVLALRWTLWDGGLTRGAARAKRFEYRKAQGELAEMRRLVKLEVRAACLEVDRAAESVEAGRGNVSLAEKALAIAGTRHQSGLTTYLEFSAANVALRSARLAHLTALRDHMKAIASLEYACGMEPYEILRRSKE